MKHLYKYLSLLIIVFVTFLNSYEAKATHAMGADLTYECVGPNQYKVRLSFYRD